MGVENVIRESPIINSYLTDLKLNGSQTDQHWKFLFFMKKISTKYLNLQMELHKNPNYGVASIGIASEIKEFFQAAKFKSISDYGAGKKNLFFALKKLGLENFEYYAYDPVFPEYGPPKSGDLVCCIDVLEHIEEEFLENVLDDLESITAKVGFFTVATGPAQKILADGRNAHLIQKPPSWWLMKICKRFEIEHMQKHPGGFLVVVKSKSFI